ncbi:MAG: YihY family inner membrane protein [Kiloniellales bacterium]
MTTVLPRAAADRWVGRIRAWLRVAARVQHIGRFLAYTGRRFVDDGCPQKAAGLGYVSLLSLVPLLAIALGVLSAFPAFDSIRAQLQALILENFIPETGEAVTNRLTGFIANASRATGPGVLAFAIIALLLLNNIDAALNQIWRVPDPRSLALRFLVYWALLSLGPLLLGASLSVSSYAFAMVQYAAATAYTSWLLEFARLISIALSTLGFALLYYVVPNRPVHPGHALLGGLVAALLFELLKAGFGAYVRSFTSYEAIYGALAAVPVFLLWMYLSWVVVLLGAEVAAALPEWRTALARERQAITPGEQLTLALALLGRLYRASQKGGALKESSLVRGLPATPAETDLMLRRLRNAGLAERSFRGRWLLARDLGGLPLGVLAKQVGLDPGPGEGWPQPAEQTVARLVAASQDWLDRDVASLLRESDERDGG